MDEEFYRLEIYVPPLYKLNPYTKEMNSHQKLHYAKSDISDKALYKFLTKTIISREQVINNENYDLKLIFWDTVGQERFNSVAKMIYKNANIIIRRYS